MVDDPYDFDWSGPRFYICHQHLPILETVVGLDGLERFCGICMVSSYQISSLKEQSEINFLMDVLSWHCRGIKQVIKGEYARRRECPRQPIKSTYKRNHFCHVIYVQPILKKNRASCFQDLGSSEINYLSYIYGPGEKHLTNPNPLKHRFTNSFYSIVFSISSSSISVTHPPLQLIVSFHLPLFILYKLFLLSLLQI